VKRLEGHGAVAQGRRQERFCEVAGARPLHRQHGEIVAARDIDIEALGPIPHPVEILVRSRRIHHRPVALRRQVVADQIIDDTATRVQHAAVEGAAGLAQLVDVIGEQVLQERLRGGSGDIHRLHVRDIEDAGAAAHGMMFCELGAVVQRHIPAAEGDNLGIEANVGVVERRSGTHAGLPVAPTRGRQVGHARTRR